MACSLCLGLIQLTSYITLTAIPSITLDKSLEYIFRHIGLVSFKELSVKDISKYVLPDPVIFLSALLAYILLQEISKNRVEIIEKLEIIDDMASRRTTFSTFLFTSEIQESKVRLNFEIVLLLIALCAAGAVYPSIPSSVYFLIFLGTGTWWALNHELRYCFGRTLQCLSIYMALHIVALVLYQNPWPQEVLNERSLIAR